MRWFPRLCSGILTLLWLAQTWFTVFMPEERTSSVGWALLGLALLACAGLLLGWTRPRAGGIIAMGAGIGFAVVNSIAALGSGPLVLIGLLTAGAFVLTGLLFLLTDSAIRLREQARWATGVCAVLGTIAVLAMTVVSLGLGVGQVMMGS